MRTVLPNRVTGKSPVLIIRRRCRSLVCVRSAASFTVSSRTSSVPAEAAAFWLARLFFRAGPFIDRFLCAADDLFAPPQRHDGREGEPVRSEQDAVQTSQHSNRRGRGRRGTPSNQRQTREGEGRSSEPRGHG